MVIFSLNRCCPYIDCSQPIYGNIFMGKNALILCKFSSEPFEFLRTC